MSFGAPHSLPANQMEPFMIWISPSHRNFLISWAISLLMPIGASREENWKIGRVESTSLTSVSLHVGFNHWAPQIDNFSLILERMTYQSSAETELRQMGIPKYLKDLQFTTSGNWRILAMTTREWALVFQTYRWHLLLLITPLDTIKNWSKILLKRSTITEESPPRRRISSAN